MKNAHSHLPPGFFSTNMLAHLQSDHVQGFSLKHWKQQELRAKLLRN